MGIRYTDITFRPIDIWPGEQTRSRRRSMFSARWGQTVQLLERELDYLNAKRVIFQIAVDDRDIRLDGKPRANARAHHPGVILAFESKFGPLKYAVDTYDGWEDNVRAIALAMEALRKVDRYGVTKRGEQYTGWRQLGAGDDGACGLYDADGARAWLEETYDGDLRRALMETHPDRGGDTDDFRRVMRAKELIGNA